jgi:hypothetical protein
MHEQGIATVQVFSFDLAGTDPSVNTIQYTELDYSRRTFESSASPGVIDAQRSL